MTIAVIHQPQYLPYLGFFHKLYQGDIYVVMDDVEFLRRGLQHRNKIKSQHGEQWLTVPVLHRQNQWISDVKIDPEKRWAHQQWQSLKTNYSRAPYFAQYASGIEDILNQEWHRICDLNMAMMQWVMDVLMIKKPVVYMSSLEAEGSKTERLINLCKAVGADTYLSGLGGRAYMDLAAFEAAGLKVLWQEFTPPTYPQMFPNVGFIPNLSIVDALFCCGPATRNFLEH
jgi:hypothetical protein